MSAEGEPAGNVQPEVAAATGTGAAGDPKAAGAAPAGYDSSTMIRTMDDLKRVAPDLYKSMTESIAQGIIRQNNRFTQRLKEIYAREERARQG